MIIINYYLTSTINTCRCCWEKKHAPFGAKYIRRSR